MNAAVVSVIFLSALALTALLYVALLSRHLKASLRPLRPVGRLASVERPLTPEGAVLVDGELWQARTRDGSSIPKGRSNVRVVGVRGHLLEVERAGPKAAHADTSAAS